jgi:uncharacterized membrane protein
MCSVQNLRISHVCHVTVVEPADCIINYLNLLIIISDVMKNTTEARLLTSLLLVLPYYRTCIKEAVIRTLCTVHVAHFHPIYVAYYVITNAHENVQPTEQGRVECAGNARGRMERP